MTEVRKLYPLKDSQLDKESLSCRDEDTRRCPACGGPGEDIVFRIDETADCYACNWVGHEDETMIQSQPLRPEEKARIQEMLASRNASREDARIKERHQDRLSRMSEDETDAILDERLK